MRVLALANILNIFFSRIQYVKYVYSRIYLVFNSNGPIMLLRNIKVFELSEINETFSKWKHVLVRVVQGNDLSEFEGYGV